MKTRLTFTEIFKEAARVFRLHFGKIILLILLVMIPIGILEGIITTMFSNNEVINTFIEIMADESATADQMGTALSEMMASLMPFLIMELIVTVMAFVFPAALIKLTLDEGRHGALTLNYMEGDIYVINDSPAEVHDVGTAGYYLGQGVRAIPRVAFCALCGSLLVSVGLSLFVLPGLIALLMTLVSSFYVVLTGKTSFRGFFDTGLILVKRPLILGVYIFTFGASVAVSYFLNIVLSHIPIPEGLENVMSVGLSTVSLCLTSVLTAFSAIAVAVTMINTLDVLGYEADEKGFLVKKSPEQ